MGSKILVFTKTGIRYYEKYPVRGFLSCMETPLHIGLDKTIVDSAVLIWPDNSYQPISLTPLDTMIRITYKKDIPQFDYSILKNFGKNDRGRCKTLPKQTGIGYKHARMFFMNLKRALTTAYAIYRRSALVVSDLTGDSLEDMFIEI